MRKLTWISSNFLARDLEARDGSMQNKQAQIGPQHWCSLRIASCAKDAKKTNSGHKNHLLKIELSLPFHRAKPRQSDMDLSHQPARPS